MTLKEKLLKATNKGSYFVIPIIEDAEVIEKIADEFAIGFGEYLEKYQGGTPNLKVLKELLEIFKKEKGL
jgi:hypothetical protein